MLFFKKKPKLLIVALSITEKRANLTFFCDSLFFPREFAGACDHIAASR
jgi:hypothetical protein